MKITNNNDMQNIKLNNIFVFNFIEIGIIRLHTSLYSVISLHTPLKNVTGKTKKLNSSRPNLNQIK